jgi:hypothetical protein
MDMQAILTRKISLVVFCLLACAGLASAQIPTKGNVFFGYSYYNTDISTVDRASTNGWEATFEGKVFPWVGLVADFDGHYGSENFPACAGFTCSTYNVNISEYNFLFGPRLSMSVGKIRPFAEVLVGAGHVNAGIAGSNTSFASAIGGGLDYRIIKPIAWRFQADYVITQFFGNTQDNVRVSTGLVRRF